MGEFRIIPDYPGSVFFERVARVLLALFTAEISVRVHHVERNRMTPITSENDGNSSQKNSTESGIPA